MKTPVATKFLYVSHNAFKGKSTLDVYLGVSLESVKTFHPIFSSTFTSIIPMKDRIKKSVVVLIVMIHSHAVLIS